MALTVNSGVAIMRLLSNLDRIEMQRSITMARLSTGRRINKASDDPAGLIALNSLNAELASVDAAIDSNSRSKAMLDTASGALAEVSSLVNDIQALTVASGGSTLSAEEIAANQAQIDSALESIDRIINETTYNGRALFSGGYRIDTSMTGPDAADLQDVRVYSRSPNGGSTSLAVNVTTAAKRATTSGTQVMRINPRVVGDTTLEISGSEGTATVVLAHNATLAQVVSTINAVKGETGVSASTSGLTQVKFTSTGYGADAFISISAISGDPAIVATAQVSKVSGSNAVINVNGKAATVSGTEFFYSANGISLSATLVDNTTGTRTITVTGGGATFQIGRNLSSKAVIGIGDLSTSKLGRAGLGYLSDLKSGGSASLASDPEKAGEIAEKAAMQVATAASRLGGFIKYQLDASTNSLQSTQESLATAASYLGDADMAAESSRLDRQNLLANATFSVLGVLVAQQQSVLSLLRG